MAKKFSTYIPTLNRTVKSNDEGIALSIFSVPLPCQFPVPSIFVNMKRQSCDGPRQDADTDVNRCGLL